MTRNIVINRNERDYFLEDFVQKGGFSHKSYENEPVMRNDYLNTKVDDKVTLSFNLEQKSFYSSDTTLKELLSFDTYNYNDIKNLHKELNLLTTKTDEYINEYNIVEVFLKEHGFSRNEIKEVATASQLEEFHLIMEEKSNVVNFEKRPTMEDIWELLENALPFYKNLLEKNLEEKKLNLIGYALAADIQTIYENTSDYSRLAQEGIHLKVVNNYEARLLFEFLGRHGFSFYMKDAREVVPGDTPVSISVLDDRNIFFNEGDFFYEDAILKLDLKNKAVYFTRSNIYNDHVYELKESDF